MHRMGADYFDLWFPPPGEAAAEAVATPAATAALAAAAAGPADDGVVHEAEAAHVLPHAAHPVVAEDAHEQDDMIDRAGSIAFRDGFAKAGQRVIIVAGVPLGTPGTTNMVRIAYVGPDREADI